MFNLLTDNFLYLNRCQLIREVPFSRSQFYKWLQCIEDRKKREPKLIDEAIACSAVEVITKYPHFSGSKGQAYMIYHRLGYIPQHFYKMLKKIVRRIIFQEVLKRALLPERTSYKHERPEKPGDIWAEDFTHIKVYGMTFYVSLLIDVASAFYLGAAVSDRADVELVEVPVIQALSNNNGCGPKRILLSDNGKQYISNEHGKLLDKLDIIHKRIPSCTPEYNGSCEVGVKEFKNVFYNVWAERETKEADKGKSIHKRIQSAVSGSVRIMNYEVPRLFLKGVTPADVQEGIAEKKIALNRSYHEKEQRKKEVKPWGKTSWNLVKDSLFENGMSDLELMTKFCFFLKRPLRKLPNLSQELLGN